MDGEDVGMAILGAICLTILLSVAVSATVFAWRFAGGDPILPGECPAAVSALAEEE